MSYPADTDPAGNPLSDDPARIAPHPDGSTTLVWFRNRSGILARNVSRTGGLGLSRRVVAQDASLIPYVAASGLGASRTVVTFARFDGVRFHIAARVLEPSGAVSADIDLGATSEGNGTSAYQTSAVLASNGDGTVTAAWLTRIGGAYIVRERRIRSNGALGPTVDVTTLPSDSGGQLTIAGRADGTASLGWVRIQPTGTSVAPATVQLVRVGSEGTIGSIVDLQPTVSGPAIGEPQSGGSSGWVDNGCLDLVERVRLLLAD